MIFLQDNACLKRELKFDDIKPRLLGAFLIHALLQAIILWLTNT